MASARGIALDIDSAGTGGWHAGHKPDARMMKAAAARGLDLSAQKARQVQIEDFRAFDAIYAMDVQNLADLEDMRPDDATATLGLFLGAGDVPDPYYGGADGFDDVLDMISRGAKQILDRMEGTP